MRWKAMVVSTALLLTGCVLCQEESETLGLNIHQRSLAIRSAEWNLNRSCRPSENDPVRSVDCTIRQERGHATTWSGACRDAGLIPTMATADAVNFGLVFWDPFQGDICIRGRVVLSDGREVPLPPQTLHLRREAAYVEFSLVDSFTGPVIEPPPRLTVAGCLVDPPR